MQWLYTQLLGTLYTLYHLELTELIRLGDLSAVLTSLLLSSSTTLLLPDTPRL